MTTERKPKIGVLLRHWDAYSLSKQCIDSLLDLGYQNLEIYLLDDASSDLSPVQLYLDFPNLRIIRMFGRIEYCKTFNLLAKVAIDDGCNYIFIVNNDTKGFANHFFEELLAEFTNTVAIVSPKVKNFDGKWLHWRDRKWLEINFPLATEGYLVKSAVWNELEGFNESYVRYCEDLDFILRLGKAGYSMALSIKTEFEHLGNGSSGRQTFIPSFYFSRNIIWIQKSRDNGITDKSHIKNWYAKNRFLLEKSKTDIYNRRIARGIKRICFVFFGLIIGITTNPSANLDSSIISSFKKQNSRLSMRLK